MTFDVIKAIDDMVDRFYKAFGDIHKIETTQHEKHLTWITTKYAELKGIEVSTKEQKPYFSQAYNNFTFIIGYRAGKKEAENYAKGDYEQGYKDAMDEIRIKLGTV